MFKLLDDTALLARRVAGFITGKGATMTAVAIASQYVAPGTANVAPMIGLAVGIPITAAMASMTHYYREKTILNNFRKEISAYFDIEPADVTLDHLRAISYGNKDLGIESQPFFREVLERNDKNRMLEIGSNLASAVLTVGLLYFRGSMIANAASTALVSSGLIATAMAPIAGTIALAAATGVVMFCMNQLVNAVGHEMFVDKGRTGYEKLEGLAVQRSKQHDITPMQVMSVIAATHPAIAQELHQNYADTKFDLLPPTHQKKLFEQFEPQLHFTELADDINHGKMHLSELGFLASGTRSGLEASPETTRVHCSFRDELGAMKAHALNYIEDKKRANHVLCGGSVTTSAQSDSDEDIFEMTEPKNEIIFPEAMPQSKSDTPSTRLTEHSIRYDRTLNPAFVARFAPNGASNSIRPFIDRIQAASPDAGVSLMH